MWLFTSSIKCEENHNSIIPPNNNELSRQVISPCDIIENYVLVTHVLGHLPTNLQLQLKETKSHTFVIIILILIKDGHIKFNSNRHYVDISHCTVDDCVLHRAVFLSIQNQNQSTTCHNDYFFQSIEQASTNQSQNKEWKCHGFASELH